MPNLSRLPRTVYDVVNLRLRRVDVPEPRQRETTERRSLTRSVDADTFRRVMSSLPTGVGVVTALDEHGCPRGLTCSAIASVSLAPPMLLVCVDLRCGSLRAIRHSEGFVVNVLAKHAEDVSQRFATACDDKFDAVGWTPSLCSGLPVLAHDATAYADCRLEREIVAGDHAILIGVVRDGGVPDGDRSPLLYWRRRYAGWPADPADPPLSTAPELRTAS